jgi:hypothetical protein
MKIILQYQPGKFSSGSFAEFQIGMENAYFLGLRGTVLDSNAVPYCYW